MHHGPSFYDYSTEEDAVAAIKGMSREDLVIYIRSVETYYAETLDPAKSLEEVRDLARFITFGHFEEPTPEEIEEYQRLVSSPHT
jgi:hypothetical protein